MGSRLSYDCNCLAVVSKALSNAGVKWSKAKEEPTNLLEEDEYHPAGLMSEQEIQRLLNESHENYQARLG